MEINQEEVWLAGEGDSYHRRNSGRPSGLKGLLQTELEHALTDLNVRPTRVLDLGCGDGTTLRWARDRWNPDQTAGIDASPEAIQTARTNDPAGEYWVGTIDSVPIETVATFDLVICHYVLHWVSRAVVLRALGEISRCIKEGGFISIADFLPDFPHAVPYQHAQGLYTYKVDYASVLSSTGEYTSIRASTHDHDQRGYSSTSVSSSRGVHAILQKRPLPVLRTD